MKQLLMVPAILLMMSCNGQNKVKMNEKKTIQTEKETTSIYPKASDFVKSPLRNRIRLELDATVNEVWALVGKLERMPEYSSGLKKLDADYDADNKCTNYTCHFFPMEEGGEVTTHSETVKWYEPNKGLVSLAEEPNILGLQQSLGIITLEDKGEQTILQWDTYFTSENDEMIKMNIMGFEQALNIDIAQNLIKKFGGKVLESYINKP
ncbi:SRPBCC family protein [Flavivirga aquimarina]|uniref:SRPBCC family protein n=1 Tax=Flavivirga aquimarina TaxID=2027862 RepID=A0ABT8W586_9FLAO|nr:SRPBCC family protein [Flavivirga aquimarina]MDO5968275.1 SRPBCC family protein [Flavivirga aquimarina]